MACADAMAVLRSFALTVIVAGVPACAPQLRMCAAAPDCSALSACVAGRCMARRATPAIANARRDIYEPVAIGYVQRDARAGDLGTPAIALLGRGDGARVLLRFALPLTAEVRVLEAYLVIERVASIDADPIPIALHVAQVIDRWDPRSLSWALQPRIVETGAPVTRVLPASGAAVRLDVRALVEQWRRRRSGDDPGLAIVADGASPSGMAFALAPTQALYADASSASLGAWPQLPAADAPKLELYVRD